MTSFQINNVYPWGRSLDEYIHMFSLSSGELSGRILDCGGGPASFCAEMAARGCSVVACDPLYQFAPEEIERRVQETHPKIVEKVLNSMDGFVWRRIKSPEHMAEIRLEAMRGFIEDFRRNDGKARYIVGTLPQLPFADDSFDLAVVSHLLFLYSEEMDGDFHVAALRELLRVAPEVRAFPLLDMKGNQSCHLESAISALQALGYRAELRRVDYEFLKGAHTMLVCVRG